MAHVYVCVCEARRPRCVSTDVAGGRGRLASDRCRRVFSAKVARKMIPTSISMHMPECLLLNIFSNVWVSFDEDTCTFSTGRQIHALTMMMRHLDIHHKMWTFAISTTKKPHACPSD